MDYSKKTIPELKVICKEYELKGISRKNKKELIELIKQKTTELSKHNVKDIPKSKNSLIAKSGNRAEDILCESTDILKYLGSQYFKKTIVKCEKIGGKKKSDICITFDDKSQITIQMKNGNGGGRGWSFDRRSVDNLPTNDSMKELVKNVCLKAGGERKEVPNNKELIQILLLGNDKNTKPQYFIHTNIKDGKIELLSVCTASIFIETLLKGMYENCNAKKTCVHLTPLIYLQRKGGGKTDHSPNDIQAKLRAMPDCMTDIKLS